MDIKHLPIEISRRFGCEKITYSKEKNADLRRKEIEEQTIAFLEKGNCITEINGARNGSNDAIKPGPDSMEKPRPRKGTGSHRKDGSTNLLNTREAAQLIGVHAGTMASYARKGMITPVINKTDTNEKLYLRSDILAFKQELESKRAKK